MGVEDLQKARADSGIAIYYHKIAITAVELLLRTNQIPQKLGYFFDPENVATESRHLLRNAKWQAQFLHLLAEKGAVMHSGNFYATKNRFYLEGLLKETKDRSGHRLMDIVCEATGIPQPKNLETIVQKINATHGTDFKVIKDDPAENQPANHNNDEPEPTVEQEPPQEKPQLMVNDDVVALLQKLQELMTSSVEIQQAMVDNIVYVRDRGNKMNERIKGLEAKLASIEQAVAQPVEVEMTDLGAKLDAIEHKLDAGTTSSIMQQDKEAIAEIVANSVNSMGAVVTSIKEEVQQVMQSTIQKADKDRLAQIRESLARIADDFAALRELTLESLTEAT